MTHLNRPKNINNCRKTGLNEEGASLLSLQTRQQSDQPTLSFAGQAEQGILALLR